MRQPLRPQDFFVLRLQNAYPQYLFWESNRDTIVRGRVLDAILKNQRFFETILTSQMCDIES
jgi:hypothetical protein